MAQTQVMKYILQKFDLIIGGFFEESINSTDVVEERNMIAPHYALCITCRGLQLTLDRVELQSKNKVPAPSPFNQSNLEVYTIFRVAGLGILGSCWSRYFWATLFDMRIFVSRSRLSS